MSIDSPASRITAASVDLVVGDAGIEPMTPTVVLHRIFRGVSHLSHCPSLCPDETLPSLFADEHFCSICIGLEGTVIAVLRKDAPAPDR